ncbi:MAG TPA: hypothetical protein VFM05_02575, partial [Candidatus Saccharimonadales bacterium]|nr:hypothetical protein [Candidatus Saccharimonadales bacterium]
KNKGTLEHPDLPGLQRELTLLIGDGLADRHMVPCEQDSLLIRANGGFEDDAEQILRSFEVNCPYDIVSVEPDLLATAGVVRYILGR